MLPRPATVANFRDLGGLPLVGGGHTRPGQVFRSDAPFDRTDLPVTYGDVRWADVIDLRSAREFGADLSWHHTGRRHRVALLDRAAPAALAGDLPDLYTDLALRGGEGLAQLIGIVGRGDGPTLVHCSFGKDRTGVAIAVLLALSGVEHSSIVADYTLSARRSRLVLQRLLDRGYVPKKALRPEQLDAKPAAIEAALEVVHNWPGGLHGYLASHGADPDLIAAAAARLRPTA